MTAKSKNNSKKPLDKNIKIAIIGLIGTIIAASVPSIIGYMSTKTQIEFPVSVTQTAESRLNSSTPTTLLPLTTETPFNSTGSSISDIEIEKRILGCDNIALPSNFDYPENSPDDKFLQVISQADKDNSILSWVKIPEVANTDSPTNAYINLNVSNIASQDWAEIDKNITVSITAEKNIPEAVNAIIYGFGCGGGGDTRLFPPINLSTTFENYTDTTTFPKYDFFTLQKGEFEQFRFPFTCQNPGYYHLSFNISFQIRGAKGSLQTNADVICPNKVTMWSYRPSREGVPMIGNVIGNYFWNGNTYSNSLSSESSGNILTTPTAIIETSKDFNSGDLILGSQPETLDAINSNVKSLTSLAKEGSFTYNGTTRYDVSLNDPNEKLLWLSNGWCAKDENLLAQNLKNISFDFSIDDEPINIENMAPRYYKNTDGLSCFGYTVVAYNWSTSTTVLTSRITINAALNNGINDYEAGKQLTWHIVVNGL
jgi:hypothetical protein